MRQHLLTVLLFLAVVAATLILAIGGKYAWDAIEQRNRAGEVAIQLLEQIQQRQAAPLPGQPQGGGPQQ